MKEYDYKGYKLFSNGNPSNPRVDLYEVTANQTMKRIGDRFMSLDAAMRHVDKLIANDSVAHD